MYAVFVSAALDHSNARAGRELLMVLSVLLRIIAFVLFVLAALIAWPEGSFEHGAALVPLGLALWVLATIVPPTRIG